MKNFLPPFLLWTLSFPLHSQETWLQSIKNYVVNTTTRTFECYDTYVTLAFESKFPTPQAKKYVQCCHIATAAGCCYCCQGPITTPVMAAAAVVALYESGTVVAQPKSQAEQKEK